MKTFISLHGKGFVVYARRLSATMCVCVLVGNAACAKCNRGESREGWAGRGCGGGTYQHQKAVRVYAKMNGGPNGG